jgi:hypothetical protein
MHGNKDIGQFALKNVYVFLVDLWWSFQVVFISVTDIMSS